MARIAKNKTEDVEIKKTTKTKATAQKAESTKKTTKKAAVITEEQPPSAPALAPKEKKEPKPKVPRKTTKKAPTTEFVDEVKKSVQVLTQDSTPAPEYTQATPEDDLFAPKEARFSQWIGHQVLLDNITSMNIGKPEEFLIESMRSALSGNDVVIYQSENPQEALLGILSSASRLLSEHLSKGEESNPSVLFVTPQAKQAENLCQFAQKLLKETQIQVHCLGENHPSHQPMDMLFCDVNALQKAMEQNLVKVQSTSVCCIQNIDTICKQDYQKIATLLEQLPQERTQKIFLSQSNTPKVRELAFRHLDTPTSLNFLPCSIQERQPRQFAHALCATQKFQILLGHLKTHTPRCAVVFTNTKPVAEWVAFKLHGNQIKVECITSVLPQKKRQQILQNLKTGETNILVMTDDMVKYLGIEYLSCIYQFDLPERPETFIARLHCIENSKNPLSISFICEDYGYNMGKIEESIGFKIHLATPDKNYFNIKDMSDYPLEANGRVKRIGVNYEEEKTEDLSHVEASHHVEATPEKAPAPEKETTRIAPPQRTSVENIQKPEKKTVHQSQEYQESRQQKNQFEGKNNNQNRKETNRNPMDNARFTRRDEKAFEAIDSAKQAAKIAAEKRKNNDKNPAQVAKQNISRPHIFSVTTNIVKEALDAAIDAAKESMVQNIEQNLPQVASWLNRFDLLKKKKK